jgi:dTDP-4-dehydrorhamnose reductase
VSLTKVLLAGATGRLGSRIADMFRDTWSICALSRRPAEKAVFHDICSPDAWEKLSLDGFDVVINCAAISSAGYCGLHPGKAWIVNSLWPSCLAVQTARLGIPLVHFSTDLVYGGGIPPYSERSCSVPASFYGWTKLLGDKAVLRQNQLSTVLRTSVLFGSTTSERPTFSQDLLEGRIETVFVDSFRHHTSIDWLAATLTGIMDSGITGLVHAAGLHDQSRAAFAEALFEHIRRPEDIPASGYTTGKIPRNLALDMSRACAILPLKPLDLASSIAREYAAVD